MGFLDLRRRRRRGERGASLVEYTLLIALIALACVAAVTTFGSNVGGSFKSSHDSMATAGM